MSVTELTLHFSDQNRRNEAGSPHGDPAHLYDPTPTAQLPQVPPRSIAPARSPQPSSHGAGYWTVIVLGFIAAAVLAYGVLLVGFQTFQGMTADSAVNTQHRNQPLTEDDAGPQQDHTATELADELELAHEGIPVDFSVPGSATGWGSTEIDSGQRLDEAPGVLLVETTHLAAFGAGTGLVLSEEGLAVTNYHVVEGSSQVSVTVADTGETYTATVLGRDAEHDVAVLQIVDAPALQVASINTETPDIGDRTASVGNGGGQGFLTSVVGEVSDLNVTILASSEFSEGGDPSRISGVMQMTQDVVPGYSGGPSVDGDGQVIGLTTAVSEGTTSEEVEGFAVPITQVLSVVEQVLAGEESETVSIGADGALGIIISGADHQVMVEDVLSGSVAEEAGLRAGDRLISVDGIVANSSDHISTVIRSRNVGDEVEVVWEDSSGQRQTGIVELQEAATN